MKFNRIFNISAGIALMVGASACSSDYLDLKPEGSVSYEEALTNEEGATLAVYGMCQSMYKQYQGIDDGSVGFNGEPEVMQYYGEVMGQDYVSIYWNNYFGGVDLMNWNIMNSSLYGGAQAAWGYCYYLISQANNLITYAPKVLDEEGNVVEDPNYNFNPVPDVSGLYAFRYAQALSIRAHAYTRLMQIYCSRYEDRFTENGDYQLTVPLRLEYKDPQDNLSCPLASWDELQMQIYADLQQAIELYEKSGMNRTYNWEPDIYVAKGLLARIAMINHDWKLAQQMAHEARANYPIMTAEEYQQGFAVPNSEWMWTNSGESNGIFFFSFGALYACNGTYPCQWAVIGAGGIDNELIKQADMYDYRALLYFSPRNFAGNDARNFWNVKACNSETMDINSGDLHSAFVSWAERKYATVKNFGWDAPYTYKGYDISYGTTACTAVFGAQFKFYGTDSYSSSNYPFMRASEMLLIEAEAAYMDGNQSLAKSVLKELNSKRIEMYSDSQFSGEQILAQIKLSRRLELWGEGFNWFDFKRWKEPIDRKAWKEGDTNSGNWPEIYANYFEPEKNRGWRWRIPKTELDYNDAINYEEAVGGED